MWVANFFVAGSMTMVIPFISLYIDSLGNFSEAYVQKWSGLVFAITFVTAFIFSPIWGRIGDKVGRKKILIFSATGLALSVLLMGFATSVWQLFILRFFMGVFTGFVPMSQAFIAVQTPSNIAGKVLGTLQTGSITGTLMGPMLGGMIADMIGYGAAFKLTSISLFLSAIVVAFGIKEIQLKVSSQADTISYSSKEVLMHIVRNPVFLVIMLISMIVQVAHFSIQPILSLYVIEINGPANIALMSGIAFSVAGLGNLFLARPLGGMGDRIGHVKVLIFLLFMAGIFYLPGAFVTNIWQLIILRFLVGIAIGGIIPVRVAYIRQEAPLSMQGEVLGYNTSLRFLGNVAGPALGGIIASMYGFGAVFVITSILLLGSGALVWFFWNKYERSQKHPSYAKKQVLHGK